MKKVFQVLVAVMAVVILANCGGKKGPEQVAEKFLKHLNNQEYAEAKKLGTEATVEMIGYMESFPSEEPAKDVKIEDMKCEVEGEKAVCTYKIDGTEEKVDLVQESGSWKVDMPKETPDESFIDEEIIDEEIIDEVVEEITEEEIVE